MKPMETTLSVSRICGLKQVRGGRVNEGWKSLNDIKNLRHGEAEDWTGPRTWLHAREKIENFSLPAFSCKPAWAPLLFAAYALPNQLAPTASLPACHSFAHARHRQCRFSAIAASVSIPASVKFSLTVTPFPQGLICSTLLNLKLCMPTCILAADNLIRCIPPGEVSFDQLCG